MVTRGAGPALQVIILGSGGGPLEDNTTAFLVRSTASEWKRGSVLAVDAGVHLSAIKKILERDFRQASGSSPHTLLTSGPFAGLELPHETILANASYLTRTLIDTYLITHPHLDHISGFVVNTAGLPGNRPKRLAGLPATIAAFRNHIFNDVIWPNLSDENNGAGLVTYMRLVDGGSPAIADGDGKGYVEVCDGLSTRPMSISHGHCLEQHAHRGSNGNSSFDSVSSPAHNAASNKSYYQATVSPDRYARRNSSFFEEKCVYDSCAYFIRDVVTGREVLIFGDVEPDSISLFPRNITVWKEAASKIAAGKISTILIECSYADDQDEDHLYGHMTPRYLADELKVLASCVTTAAYEHERSGGELASPKRKRSIAAGEHEDAEVTARRSLRNKTGGMGKRGSAVEMSDVGMHPTYNTNGSSSNHTWRGSFSSNELSPRSEHPFVNNSSLTTPISPILGLGGSQPAGSAGSGSTVSFADFPPVTSESSVDRNMNINFDASTSSTPSTLTDRSVTAPSNLAMPPPAPPTSNSLVDVPYLPPAEQGSSFVSPSGHTNITPTLNHLPAMNINTSPTTYAPTTPSMLPRDMPPPMRLRPLEGLQVVVIHVKERLEDKLPARDLILGQLRAYESTLNLGVEFLAAEVGECIWA